MTVERLQSHKIIKSQPPADRMILRYTTSTQIVENILNEKSWSDELLPLATYHPETLSHLKRVGYLDVDLGYQNTLSPEDIDLLARSALVHDIGKRGVCLEVLDKPGKHTPEERQEMKSHVRKGYILLEELAHQKVREIMVTHHEFQHDAYPRTRQDRRRKPRPVLERRKTDPAVLTLAQILAAADVFDALSAPRCYKEPFTIDQIEEIMRKDYKGAGIYVDQVLDRFG